MGGGGGQERGQGQGPATHHLVSKFRDTLHSGASSSKLKLRMEKAL
jgi:hypothetical protein